MVEMQTVPDKLGCKNETEAVALTSSCFVLSPNFPAIDLCHAKGSPPVHSQTKFLSTGASPGVFLLPGFSLWSAGCR